MAATPEKSPQPAEALDGASLLGELLRKPLRLPLGGGEPPVVTQNTATHTPPKRAEHFTAIRTMDGGYWIECTIKLKTAKGIQITNGMRTIWLPRSQIHQMGTTRIRASEYIVNERYREIIATDPDGVHERIEKFARNLKPIEWNHPGGDTR